MKYNSIIYNDTANGEGMRMSYFCQGCSIHCQNCFNIELQDFKGGKEFTNRILEESLSVFELFKNNYNGITLIGGEIMDNVDFGLFVAREFKKRFSNKTIWIYSGYTFEEIIKSNALMLLLKLSDVLVDGKFIEELKDHTLIFRGSSNQRIIDVQKSLSEHKVVIYNNY